MLLAPAVGGKALCSGPSVTTGLVGLCSYREAGFAHDDVLFRDTCLTEGPPGGLDVDVGDDGNVHPRNEGRLRDLGVPNWPAPMSPAFPIAGAFTRLKRCS